MDRLYRAVRKYEEESEDFGVAPAVVHQAVGTPRPSFPNSTSLTSAPRLPPGIQFQSAGQSFIVDRKYLQSLVNFGTQESRKRLETCVPIEPSKRKEHAAAEISYAATQALQGNFIPLITDLGVETKEYDFLTTGRGSIQGTSYELTESDVFGKPVPAPEMTFRGTQNKMMFALQSGEKLLLAKTATKRKNHIANALMIKRGLMLPYYEYKYGDAGETMTLVEYVPPTETFLRKAEWKGPLEKYMTGLQELNQELEKYHVALIDTDFKFEQLTFDGVRCDLEGMQFVLLKDAKCDPTVSALREKGQGILAAYPDINVVSLTREDAGVIAAILYLGTQFMRVFNNEEGIRKALLDWIHKFDQGVVKQEVQMKDASIKHEEVKEVEEKSTKVPKIVFLVAAAMTFWFYSGIRVYAPTVRLDEETGEINVEINHKGYWIMPNNAIVYFEGNDTVRLTNEDDWKLQSTVNYCTRFLLPAYQLINQRREVVEIKYGEEIDKEAFLVAPHLASPKRSSTPTTPRASPVPFRLSGKSSPSPLTPRPSKTESGKTE